MKLIYLTLAMSIFTNSAFATTEELKKCWGWGLGSFTKGFLEMDEKGEVKILREGVSKKAAEKVKLKTGITLKSGPNGQYFDDEGWAETYTAKHTDFGSTVRASDRKKFSEFIGTYLTTNETVEVVYDKDPSDKDAKVRKITYKETNWDRNSHEIETVFTPNSDCGVSPSINTINLHSKSITRAIPNGAYDIVKCAEFKDFLNKQEDLVACMNSAAKLLRVKNELLVAKGQERMNEKEEKKFIEDHKKNILKTFGVFEEAVTFHNTCDQIYTSEALVKIAHELKKDPQGKRGEVDNKGTISR